MDNFDNLFKKRFSDAQTTDGIDADALWDDIESGLEEEPKGGSTSKPNGRMLGILALLFSFTFGLLLFLKNKEQTVQITESNASIEAPNTQKEKQDNKQSQAKKDALKGTTTLYNTLENNTEKGTKIKEKQPINVFKSKKSTQGVSLGKTELYLESNTEGLILRKGLVQSNIQKENYNGVNKNNDLLDSALQTEFGVDNKKTQPTAEHKSTPTQTPPSLTFGEGENQDVKEPVFDTTTKQSDVASKEERQLSTQQITDIQGAMDSSKNTKIVQKDGEVLAAVGQDSLQISKTDTLASPPTTVAEVPSKIAKQKRLTIGLFAGMTQFLSRYKNLNDKAGLETALNSAHKAGLGSSLSLGVGYDIHQNWTIRSGIAYLRLQNEFNYQNQWDTLIPDPRNTSGNLIRGLAERTVRHHNQFNYFSVPLSIGFSKNKSAWKYGFDAGIALNFLHKQTGKSLNQDLSIQTFDQGQNTAAPYPTRFLGYQLKPFLAYRVTKSTEFRLQPTLQYSQTVRSDFYGLSVQDILMDWRIGFVFRP